MTETTVPKYWRSLDELEQSSEFQEFVHREFPVAASEYPAGVSRRKWLKLMGASFALASVAGCRWQTEKIVPQADRPVDYVPGTTTKYATTIELAGAPRHLVITCYDGRPIKVEGNPDHPGSLGGSDAFSQATTLSMYDPDRSSSVRQRLASDASVKSWEVFDEYLSDQWPRGNMGAKLGILMEPSSSLSVDAMTKKVADALPNAKFYEYAPLTRENEVAGAELAFGSRLRTHFKLAEANVIAGFDADLLCGHPNSTRYSRDWAATRELKGEGDAATMGRTYAVESQFSILGTTADHRAAIKSSDIGMALAEVRDQVKARLEGNTPEEPKAVTTRMAQKKAIDETEKHDEKKKLNEEATPPVTAEQVLWALAEDLANEANRGKSVVAVGPSQPAEVHAIAFELNSMLGNIGKTIVMTDEPKPSVERGSITDLSADLDAGNIDSLVIVGGNPAYDAPADLKLGEKIDKLVETIRLGYYEDETSDLCQWHLPMSHPFEAWGDAVSYEGLPSTAQPMIDPIYETITPLELLAKLAGVEEVDPQALAREALATTLASEMTGTAWRKLLDAGFVDSSVFTAAEPKLVEGFEVTPPARIDSTELEVVFTPSSSVYDGRFANNGWLQETPNFITKVCWDNVAIVSPKTADDLKVKQNELIEITVGEATIKLPVYILPGQANGSIGVELGYGRTAAGSVGGLSIPRFRRYWSPWGEAEEVIVGSDVYPLRNSDAQYVAKKVETKPTGESYKLATTQDHFAIDTVGLELIAGRIGELVRERPLEYYKEDPAFAPHMVHVPPTDPLFPERDWRERPNAWGMSVDLNKCTGCNACMLACQSENNVPVVGKEQVLMGREMHWIRIDRYFHGMPDDFNNEDPASPSVATQMVTCQQCESAPCEQVCPVAATVHSDEGLNDMVYNRCVGTRYCANNCPYKVRRFNYFHMTGYMEKPENQLIQLANNPEVTVRSRGVMEKCTFCTQRIAKARNDVRTTGQPMVDGELQTACQQACPTRAIEFGDLNNPDSQVSKNHANPRAYGMLAELDVRPRNKYMAKVTNPHWGLAVAVVAEPHHGHGGHGDHDGHDDHDDKDHPHGEEDKNHEHEGDDKDHSNESTVRRDVWSLPIIG